MKRELRDGEVVSRSEFPFRFEAVRVHSLLCALLPTHLGSDEAHWCLVLIADELAYREDQCEEKMK
jgi:hypothetical protein